MDQLRDRYVLSVILSFLGELDGTSLLLCRKRWTKSILPIFRLPSLSAAQGNHVHPSETLVCKKYRHRYIVYPVPDAATRLDRRNTRKWRRKWKILTEEKQKGRINLSIQDLAKKEWMEQHSSKKENVTTSGTDHKTQHPLLQFWSPTLEKSLLSSTPQSSLFLPGITLLASYPRSGNTYVRSLLESITGFCTLSDTRADRPLSIALAEQHGLVGEGLSQPPICKTHWPERMGCCPFNACRVILLVRNPFDVIDSYWHLNATNTHTQKVTDEVYLEHQSFFQALVRNEWHVWSAFLDFYWKQQNIEVLLVRYEDLMVDPKEEMKRMLQFCTPNNWWLPQLQAVLGGSTSSSNLHGYRSSHNGKDGGPTTSIGRSLKTGIFRPSLLQELGDKKELLDPGGWMERLGYDIWTQRFPDNLERLPALPMRELPDPGAAVNTTPMPINDNVTKELRSRRSPFGRNLRDWRRQHTNDDHSPFPTLQKK